MNVGINYINKRYSKANNKYCSDYDNEKLKTYITYLDMNNLYGYAMTQYLPHANFKWVKNMDEIEQKLRKIKNNSSIISQKQIQNTPKIYIMNIVIIYQPHKKLTYKKNGCQIIVQKLYMNIMLLQHQLKN